MYSPESNLAWVAGKIAPELRTEDLGIERYKLIAPLPEKEQEKWIKKAAKDDMTVAALREALRAPTHTMVEPRERTIELTMHKLLKDIRPELLDWPEFAGVIREIKQLNQYF